MTSISRSSKMHETIWEVLGSPYYQISLLNTEFLLQWCIILSFKYSNKMQILLGDIGIQLSVAKTGKCPRHFAWLCGQGQERKWAWGRGLHLSTQGISQQLVFRLHCLGHRIEARVGPARRDPGRRRKVT